MSDTTQDVTLIQPMPVQRDETGCWWHPGMPEFDEDHRAEYRAWLDAQGLETTYGMLQYQPEHPLYDAWFEHGLNDMSSWTPEPPAGEGWFTLWIDDTEDGPIWVWARRGGVSS